MSAVAATCSRESDSGSPTLPVIEIFGPTVQGEGPDAGQPAYFVRFGGCDYRCLWCDSMYAVDPVEVRSHAERLTVEDISRRLTDLASGPNLVVLSGGNPALLDLDDLVSALQGAGYNVAVETQGSRWRDWLARVDRLIVSPKPPSSGMAGVNESRNFADFMAAAERHDATAALKVVVFDETDLDWAQAVHDAHPTAPFFISVGTDVGLDDAATLAAMRARFRWLATAVAERTALGDVRVLPQLHVIAWGTARGV